QSSFQLYFKNFRFFISYVGWILAPIAIVLVLSTVIGGVTITIIDVLLNVVVYSVIMIWLSVVFIKATPQLIADQTIKTRKLNQEAWRLIVPFALASTLAGLITVGGYLLLIIPGIIFSVWFAFSATMVVLEKIGITESIGASKALVAGRFWKVLWRLLTGGIIIAIIYLLLLLIITLIYSTLSGVDLIMLMSATPTYPQDVLNRIVEMLIIPVSAVYQVLLYLEVKRTK
ncbi:MAG: hypothetical protein Q8P30_01945, partial [Candidatus Uhrbacteria bacterium]|nr:hypothetical protein [Candidatus Uhrbacteria bacterium]